MGEIRYFANDANLGICYSRDWHFAEPRCRIIVVGTLEVNQSRVALVAVGVIALAVCVLLGIVLLIRPKTPFEEEHARAERKNPHWLKVEITTSDGRSESRENEAIWVVAHFSSAMPNMYKADVADGESLSASTDTLHISNGEERPLLPRAVVCCASRLIGLDDEPFTPPSRISLKLAPGDYEIYLTSRRVFNWDTSRILTHAAPSSFEVASNMLKIRILADSVNSHGH